MSDPDKAYQDRVEREAREDRRERDTMLMDGPLVRPLRRRVAIKCDSCGGDCFTDEASNIGRFIVCPSCARIAAGHPEVIP